MQTHTHYRNKPIKMAKCGNYSYTHCVTKWRQYNECKSCTLVKRHPTDLYKWVNGTKYKKCSKCGQYYPIRIGFYKSVGRPTYMSWCKFCKSKYQLTILQKNLTEHETKSI